MHMAEKIATRDGYGKALVELGKTNPMIALVSADLEDSTRSKWFAQAYPERSYTVGIAEQDMVGTAAGLALTGYTVFVNSFAVFMTNRAYDQIRMDLCYNDLDVKIICSHAGLSVGEDGASAQCLEDLALMRVLPNMKVVVPVDAIEAAKATRAFVKERGPMYMRTTRSGVALLTKEADPFEIGKANVMREGKDVTVIACGIMVAEALSAAETLKAEKIDVRVINMHTIKPIDEEIIIGSAAQTGAIVTAEEHQVHGGLGGAVAEIVTTRAPVPMEMVAVADTYGESGKPDELLKAYHVKDVDIIEAVRRVLKRKPQATRVG
jgi:transketolase